MTSDTERLLNFYRGQKPDSAGRNIEQIWNWDYNPLESTHDYIQWLFPLKQPSPVNPQAPILNPEVIEIFRNSQELRSRLLKSFLVMLDFYGLQCQDNDPNAVIITQAENYSERQANWLRRSNHNFLRITRILTCLHILGLEQYAIAFLDCLKQIYQTDAPIIGEVTYRYWNNAI
ncbi:hypothetical protein H6G20_07975 [Desertifilum sp. FACHB-1129]|uniref:Opioid growth factor receptor (OGFr) conserved domain-containing protein n=2 Tax=Desertifilum tharense IPPAS B-1220 TaxID=1781255 RepID=A0A1E5QMI1_9CYAN|nr:MULTISPECIES: opioid growth factor receptor-related protein [Desertifilum]MDA0210594.1 opioid growth factor receptor-related protein [Cyanobacteria bacterium FC1]MBD2311595.1 hypothetical protein [Desertifilum sp. FACHB-1129]MBD2323169.1 hypothetical protein [Desertifilum sp. FACHB-866]MBD2333014.1 hypothetical protein [Desertifilum sp. FACHB-868]OEJ75804.1 hypothetical protein BH720_07700 [Desertifilum tharense IPPAS B-1220]